MGVLTIVIVTGLAGVLWRLVRNWERTEREHWPVFVLLALLVIETTVYENQDLMPRSIFHPGTGSLEFRLPEAFICVALLARLSVRGWPRRIAWPSMLIAGWAAWMVVAAAEGVLRHNSFVKLPYEAKSLVYVAGGYALVAGVPIERFTSGFGWQKLMRWAAMSAALLIALQMVPSVIGGGLALNIPLFETTDFGVLGNDAAALFVSIGTVGLLLEMAKPSRNTLNMIAALPLLASPFFAGQRADLLLLAGAALLVLIALAGKTARRNFRITGGPVLLGALALTAAVLAGAVVPAIASHRSVQLPLYARLEQTAVGGSKIQSAEDRLSKWSVALKDARQHPLLGEGLGFEYEYYVPGPNTYVLTDITENTELDIWLWTGLTGVALYVGAVLPAIAQAISAWRRTHDPLVAALTLGALAVVVGFLAKSQVESILDKYRIATAFGLYLGMLRAAYTGSQRESTGRTSGPEVAELPGVPIRSDREREISWS